MRRELQSPLESLDRPPAPRFSRGSDALSGLIEHLAAAPQEIALGRVLGAGDRRLIRLRGLGVAAETPQQVGPDSVVQVVAAQIETVDEGQRRRSSVPC